MHEPWPRPADKQAIGVECLPLGFPCQMMPSVDLQKPQQIELSIVVPLRNEEAIFPELIRRLTHVLDTIGLRTEVTFINNGSEDRTLELMEEAHAKDPRFTGISLSRDFGHQLSVTAGLAHARGDVVAVMDGDLQDPPELLRSFYDKLKEGYDVVYAIRRKRKESLFKRMAYAGFYRLLKRLATIDIPLDTGDFCVMTRRVVQTLSAMPERRRFIRGMRSWVGFRQTGQEYERGARTAGESKYTLTHLLGLALDGMITFSERPLRVSTFAGLGAAFVSLLWGTYILIWRIVVGGELPGFATLAVAMLFLGAVQLICLGILGEYVGRIHNEVKGRPLYVIDKII